jgi:predicted alpha/beta-hydrolase family hydrolase
MLPSAPVPAASIRAFTDDSADPKVHGFLHQPETPTGQALVLTHGAGSNAAAPLLVALADAFTTAGFTVLRCDLPYRQSRPYGPPGPGDAARDRAGLVNAIAAMKKMSDRVFLGGHSYGGRQASMLCAEQPELVSGLLLLSYPLHPPRKPDQLRTQHLFNLRVPTLFVHGTRDPFGTLGEIESVLKLIPARTKLFPIENAGHDLGFKGKAKREELPANILAEFQRLL